MNDSFSKYRTQSGVGLIEVLIAVVVASLGFLAAGRMQAEGVRNTQTAQVSSQAGYLIKDVADRMRSNLDGVAAGHYDAIDTETASMDVPDCVSEGASGTTCNPAEIAQNDIAEWSSYIKPGPNDPTDPALPSGDTTQARGTVTKQGDVYRVSVYWTEFSRGQETLEVLEMDIKP